MIGEILFFGFLILTTVVSVWYAWWCMEALRDPPFQLFSDLEEWLNGFKITLECQKCDKPAMMINASRGEDLKIKCSCGYEFINSIFIEKWTII